MPDLAERDFNEGLRHLTRLSDPYTVGAVMRDGRTEWSKPVSVVSDLLDTARSLWTLGYGGPAVVTAQTICEAYFQDAMEALFRVKGMDSIHAAVAALASRSTFSLGREEHLKLYAALSGDRLQSHGAFWGPYKNGLKARDRWVHQAWTVDGDQAAGFITAVADLIEHVEGVLATLGAAPPLVRMTDRTSPAGPAIELAPTDDPSEARTSLITPQPASDTSP